MSNNKNLPVKFAKNILGELSIIHATVLKLSDFLIADLAKRSNLAVADVSAAFRKKQDERMEKFYKHYLKETGLE